MFREFQKIYNRRVALGLLAFILGLSFLLGVFFIQQCEFGYVSNEEGNEEVLYTGAEAIHKEKEAREKITADISCEHLTEVLNYYHSFNSSVEGEQKLQRKYPERLQLLDDVYTKWGDVDYSGLKDTQTANDFYERRNQNLKERMKRNGNSNDGWLYSEKEVQHAIKFLQKIKTPYRDTFHKGWDNMISVSYCLNYVFALCAIFLAGQIFSFEKSMVMDMVIMSNEKKKMRHLVWKKIGGVCAYLTILYVAAFLVMRLISILAFGNSGGDSSIQVMPDFFFCLYDMKYWQFFLYAIFVGWIGLMSIVVITAIVNAFTGNKYITYVISILMIFGALAGWGSTGGEFKQHFFALQPIVAGNILMWGNSLQTFSFGPIVMRSGEALLLVCMVIIAVGVSLMPYIYCKKIQK